MSDIYSFIENLLVSGGSIAGIRKLCADREWTSDDVDAAIQTAYENMLAGNVNAQYAVALKRLNAIYLAAASKHEYAVALNAQKEIDAITLAIAKQSRGGKLKAALNG